MNIFFYFVFNDDQQAVKMSTNSTTIPNKRNIEIKARFANADEYERRVNIAKELTQTTGEIINQHDVFYNVPNGRLKLRYVQVSTNYCLLF